MLLRKLPEPANKEASATCWFETEVACHVRTRRVFEYALYLLHDNTNVYPFLVRLGMAGLDLRPRLGCEFLVSLDLSLSFERSESQAETTFERWFKIGFRPTSV